MKKNWWYIIWWIIILCSLLILYFIFINWKKTSQSSDFKENTIQFQDSSWDALLQENTTIQTTTPYRSVKTVESIKREK